MLQRCRVLALLAMFAGFSLAPPAQAQQIEAVGAKAYQEHCASCHGSDSARFISRVIEHTDGKLLLRKNKQPAEDFLRSHGAADAAERENLIRLMHAVLGS